MMVVPLMGMRCIMAVALALVVMMVMFHLYLNSYLKLMLITGFFSPPVSILISKIKIKGP